MQRITVAICVYNGADELPALVAALRQQRCPVAAEILVIDNNSTDETATVAARLAGQEGMPLRVIHEPVQGIPHARNRAIEESSESTYLAFIDVDELPGRDWLATAVDALEREGADCVGGRIRVMFPGPGRPAWLADELLGFLGELDHGARSFWVQDSGTPVWSGNIAYRTSIFGNGLRFDTRFNRAGSGISGGEDAVMFADLLKRQAAIRYRPDMLIEHHVVPGRLRRSYFLKLHYQRGLKHALNETREQPRGPFGIPPYMIRHVLRQLARTGAALLTNRRGALRQAMNLTHELGLVRGCMQRRKAEAGD